MTRDALQATSIVSLNINYGESPVTGSVVYVKMYDTTADMYVVGLEWQPAADAHRGGAACVARTLR